MAILRILKSCSSFDGVRYNQYRIDKGQGTLLSSHNFGPVEPFFEGYKDYQAYLESWSAKNSRIKNPQLHLSISVKGKSMSAEELKRVGEEWMNRMGYGQNPYLIYFHNNTKNNHIHIVTTRVDQNGNKISDKFEKERGLRVLNEILGIDENQELRDQVAAALRFSFTTVYQLAELLQQGGMKCRINKKDGSLSIKKGSSVLVLNKDLIDGCIKRYHKDISSKRKKQLQSFIYKYAPLFDREVFSRFMKDKFGLSFIYYGKNDTINGFTIIDYKNKAIYKGSEVFSAKNLEQLFSTSPTTFEDCIDFIRDYFSLNKTLKEEELNNMLAYLGFSAKDDRLYSKDGYSVPLPDDIIKALEYNKVIDKIMYTYNPINKSERIVLSRLFGINPADLKGRGGDDKRFIDREYYKALLSDIIGSGERVDAELHRMGIRVYMVGDDKVLFDQDKQVVISCNSLGLSWDDEISYQTFDNTEEEYLPQEFTPVPSLADLLYAGNIGASSDKPKRRRRK